jgi:hypothetical protein
MPTNTEGKGIQAVSSQGRARTSDVYNQDELFRRRDDLQQRMPSIGKGTGFLGGAPSPYAASLQPQRMPGAQYANYERAAPNVGGTLQAPQVPAGFVPPGTQPVVLPNPNAPAPTTAPAPKTSAEPDDPATEADKLLADINKFRIIEGLEPFETFEDFQRDIGIFEGIGNIGMADGGIASLEPQYFEAGGFASAMQSLGSLGNRMQGKTSEGASTGYTFGNSNTGVAGGKTGVENSVAGSGDLSGKSPEELMKIIADLKAKLAAGGGSSGIGSLLMGGGGKEGGGIDPAMAQAAASMVGGMADGGTVQYPRMNGQISGPGTERSDDIPAMLSDGEFVVNAKALRGIGKMDGANGSKEEQRKKGARMMYAMQKAGEQAMRKG